MAESVAGESSPQQETSKAPWEAGFWGKVGEGITAVKESLLGPSKALPEPSKKQDIMPWDSRYWEGRKLPKPKVPRQNVKFTTEADVKEALVIQPGEEMPDTQSIESNIAEIEAEIKKTKSPEAKAILMQERAKLERKRNGKKG